jgi:hypothetical protein
VLEKNGFPHCIINEVESLISLYADDTFLILDGSENSLREALECFESFNKVSGLKMNSSITKAVWVGNKKYADQIILFLSEVNLVEMSVNELALVVQEFL